MPKYQTVVDVLIENGLMFRVGSSRVKLTRAGSRLVSSLAATMAHEWDGVAYRMARSENARAPNVVAQKQYAKNASSALRQLVTRSVQRWEEDKIIFGNALAEDQHRETSFEFDPTASIKKG
jgi:hypothetical protein